VCEYVHTLSTILYRDACRAKDTKLGEQSMRRAILGAPTTDLCREARYLEGKCTGSNPVSDTSKTKRRTHFLCTYSSQYRDAGRAKEYKVGTAVNVACHSFASPRIGK
jgi:hypothetical protein